MGRVAPSVIPAGGTRPALTKDEVMVGDCSGGNILSHPHVPKRMGGSCFSTSLGDSHFVLTSLHQKKNQEITAALPEELIATLRTYQTDLKDFCSNAESANSISNMLKSLEGKYTRDMSLLKDKVGSSLNTEESFKILPKTYFPDHLECPGQGQLEPEQVQECSGQGAVGLDLRAEDILEYTTTEKVRNAIRSFGSKKKPGPDGFKLIVLKNLHEKAVIHLTELYKMSISTQQIPSSWRKMDVIFYLSQGKRITHPQNHTCP